MALKQFRFKLTGVAPLLMHNGSMSDPANPAVKLMKRIGRKRIKTSSDWKKFHAADWFGSLFVKDDRIVLPGELFEAAFIKAAGVFKKRESAKAGVLCTGYPRLEYDGPKDLKKLMKDKEFRYVTRVGFRGKEFERVRPMFKTWGVEIDLIVDPAHFNDAEVKKIMDYCGDNVAICDWRPKYGRFKAKLLE